LQEATPALQQAYYAGVVQQCENALLHMHVLRLRNVGACSVFTSREILRLLVVQLERHDENLKGFRRWSKGICCAAGSIDTAHFRKAIGHPKVKAKRVPRIDSDHAI
jgi:hypothetical protein